MLEVRYTAKLTPMILVALLLFVCSVWQVSRLFFSVALILPTSATIIKLLCWLVVLIYAALEIASWFRRRNTTAFKIGLKGFWTEQKNWISWQLVDMKVSRRYDVVSITYDDVQGSHLFKWKLSELAVRKDELIKAERNFHSL